MARQRLAIVGPTDSVNLIHMVAKDRDTVFIPVPIVYADASEVPEILQCHRSEADIWLFSGVVPYRYALTVPRWNKPLLYIPHTGSSLYRAFLQITRTTGLPLNNISFDTYSRTQIEEIFSDLDCPLPQLYINYYEGIISAEELTEFHHNLWVQNKTQVAVTCFHKTAIQLNSLGVPAFRIWPTLNSIRGALDTAMNLVETMRFSESQIAVVYVGIDHYSQLVRDTESSYDVNRIEMRLHELLIDFSQHIGGSLIPQGRGNYLIFSTRGRITAITQGFTVLPLLATIKQKLQIHVSGGIGFGSTAYQAEENAHLAHELANRLGPGQWMIVTDDRQALGPLNTGLRLNDRLGSDHTKQRALAKHLKISLLTLNQLAELMGELDTGTISINDMAARLDITPRSARRVMQALKEAGIAYFCGEKSGGKGRPHKVYRFSGDNLLN